MDRLRHCRLGHGAGPLHDLLRLPAPRAERPARQLHLPEEGRATLHGLQLHGWLHCHHHRGLHHHRVDCHIGHGGHRLGHLARIRMVLQVAHFIHADPAQDHKYPRELARSEVLLREGLHDAPAAGLHLHVLADVALLLGGHQRGDHTLPPRGPRDPRLHAADDGGLHARLHEPGDVPRLRLQDVPRRRHGLPHPLQPRRDGGRAPFAGSLGGAKEVGKRGSGRRGDHEVLAEEDEAVDDPTADQAPLAGVPPQVRHLREGGEGEG
mmetsp:Transcript_115625/g.360129  ORF Transcript_115625/g.360129 Transcript_115625/m.360129 type:complete len:266 (-) Transcript_115625:487-1284(-)